MVKAIMLMLTIIFAIFIIAVIVASCVVSSECDRYDGYHRYNEDENEDEEN